MKHKIKDIVKTNQLIAQIISIAAILIIIPVLFGGCSADENDAGKASQAQSDSAISHAADNEAESGSNDSSTADESGLRQTTVATSKTTTVSTTTTAAATTTKAATTTTKVDATTTIVATTTKAATVPTTASTAKVTTVPTTTSTTKAATTTTTAPPVVTTTAATTLSLDQYADEVLKLVNQHRRDNGVAELASNATLNRMATLRANEIVSLFSHTRPNGGGLDSVFEEYNVKWWAIGENIAAGQTSPAEVMEAWMNSEGHKNNILSSDFSSIGIGAVKNGRTIYWVQIFATLQ